jgi:hypothetical protein
VKPLDVNQMLEIVEADAVARVFLAEAEARAHPGYVAEWLKPGAKAYGGTICQLLGAGTRLAVFWYWVSESNKTLVVNAVASQVTWSIFHELQVGIERLARKLRCTRVECSTARAGIARQLHDAGYLAEEIRFSRTLPPIQ